ncbi:MAG: hypothetical protein ACI9VT_002629, partial [Psychroserpens sp.]
MPKLISVIYQTLIQTSDYDCYKIKRALLCSAL